MNPLKRVVGSRPLPLAPNSSTTRLPNQSHGKREEDHQSWEDQADLDDAAEGLLGRTGEGETPMAEADEEDQHDASNPMATITKRYFYFAWRLKLRPLAETQYGGFGPEELYNDLHSLIYEGGCTTNAKIEKIFTPSMLQDAKDLLADRNRQNSLDLHAENQNLRDQIRLLTYDNTLVTEQNKKSIFRKSRASNTCGNKV